MHRVPQDVMGRGEPRKDWRLTELQPMRAAISAHKQHKASPYGTDSDEHKQPQQRGAGAGIKGRPWPA
jgi:hypothetical protein